MLNLSSSAQSLTDVIGFDNTSILVNACGKRSIYIPKTVANDHWLLKTLDTKTVHALVGEYASCIINLPSSNDLERTSRNTEIVFKKLNGEKTSSLARQYNLSRRQVRKIIEKNKKGTSERG
ncbi:MAG: Mor transcription activator family protein [Desulfovibrio sp.]